MCRTHKSYIKHVTELQAAGRRICSDPAGINTAVLIFQSYLVLPISVQILHISHSLPASTPRISINHNYNCSFGWYVGATLFNRLLISPVSEYAASFNISRLSKKCSLSNSIGFPIWISLFLVS